MANKLTIITAFFDIGRGDMSYDNCEPRSFERYLGYFKGWARVKNDMIIYAQKGLGEKIMNVRRKFGLEDKTKIVEIDNVYALEPGLVERMKKVENDEAFLNFRFFSSEISNTAEYNYVMLMKYYFLRDAAAKYAKDDDLVWIDFGFNHGGKCYSNPEEFDFELKPSCKISKVQLFALPGKKIENISPIRSLQYQSEHIEGAPIVCPARLSSELYSECVAAMDALIRIGCIDDDQQLLLMSWRNNPELFEIKASYWFMPIKEYLGGAHLSISPVFQEKMEGGYSRRRYLSGLRFVKRKITGRKTRKEDFLSRQGQIADEEWPNW